MTYTGYEAPVQIPNLDVYDTTMMRMYLQEAKNQYEQGKEEMKDFMKMYNDFYSPVPGATEAYNNMTIGGARNMINQMLANGIDPYKSPEARAAISRYIASVPTGVIKQLEQQKEDYSKYQDAVRDAINRGTYNELMEKYYLHKEGLDNFQATSRNPDGTIKVNDWTRLAPAKFSTLESITNPFFKDLEKIDFVGNDPKHPGYSLYKVADDVLANALRGGVEAVKNNSNGDFYVYQAEQKLNNAGITRQTNPNDYDQLVQQQLAQDVKDANAQAWQTKSDWDKYAQELRGYARAERMEGIRHANTMEEKGYVRDPKTNKWVVKQQDGGDGLSLTNDLYRFGMGKIMDTTGTSDIKKGQEILLKRFQSNLLKQYGLPSGKKLTIFGKTYSQSDLHIDAHAFLDKYFKQSLSGQAFSNFVIGKPVLNGTINYRPGYANRITTYAELGKNLATGGKTKYNFSHNDLTEGTYKNAEALINHLNSIYDPNDPEKIKIVHDGGEYTTLGKDGYVRGHAPVTIVINNGKDKAEKIQIPFEVTVGINAFSGMADTKNSAEGRYRDQKTTTEAGATKNSANKTVIL